MRCFELGERTQCEKSDDAHLVVNPGLLHVSRVVSDDGRKESEAQ